MRGLPRRRAFGGERGRVYRASMLIGTVGFGFFIYGKKQRRAPHLAAGVLLMVYPYFVPGVALMVVIAGAIVGSLYLASYLGL
jgi:hypothetical protein